MQIMDFRRGERTHSIIIKDLQGNKSTAFSIKSTWQLAQIKKKMQELINKFAEADE